MLQLHPQALRLPFTLFRSQRRMDDNQADDMKCGDLSEYQLRKIYRLEKVSGMYDPWRAERTDFPISNYAVTRQKMPLRMVAEKLFAEFRRDSLPFSFMGHRGLFLQLIDHFQRGEGKPFSSSELDGAYRRLIEGEQLAEEKSSTVINNFIRENINWKESYFPEIKKEALSRAITSSTLPKFIRWKDKINGLGMSIHDIYATQIHFLSLDIKGDTYKAVLQYKGQDHFGLDDRDIMDPRFHALNIFRIWFLLQRWQKFAYKPFFTDVTATITLTGRKR